MNNQELEQKLKTAVSNAVPDVFGAVMEKTDSLFGAMDAYSGEPSEESRVKCSAGAEIYELSDLNSGEKTRSNKKSRFRLALRIVAAAACLALVFGAAFGAKIYYNYVSGVDTIVTLDVNPSLEMDLDRREKVVKLVALNDDAEAVLNNAGISGQSIGETISSLVASLIDNGYLRENSNSIMVTVQKSDNVSGNLLKEKIITEINNALNEHSVTGSVLAQVMEQDDDLLNSLANEYDISPGRAKLIQSIVENDPSQSFSDLAKLSVNDLNLIASSGNAASGNISISGNAAALSYISEQAAQNAAFADLGIKASDVSGLSVKMALKAQEMAYTVDFDYSSNHYVYYINAASGKITEKKSSKLSAATTPEQTASSAEQSSQQQPQNPTVVPKTYIGADSALDAALKKAGLSKDQILVKDVEFENREADPVYEVDFSTSSNEYEYIVDAYTANILKENIFPVYGEPAGYDREHGRFDAPPDRQDEDDRLKISENDAKNIVFRAAGVDAKKVSFVDVSEHDGMYNVEFQNDGQRYDYTVDGSTGEILSSRIKTRRGENEFGKRDLSYGGEQPPEDDFQDGGFEP